MAVKISKVLKNGSGLNIEWTDGKKSNFNFMWLRDNCPLDMDEDTRERTFNILEVSENIHPKNYKINLDGKLEIEWSEGHHTSFYDPKWLRKNCYTLKEKYVSPYQLWDSKLNSNLESISIDYENIMQSDEVLIKWLNLLHEKVFQL